MATILQSFVGSCIKELKEIITEEAILILGVKEDLRELERTMTQIQCFLNDAEKRRTEESSVINWLGELKDVMYDADDIIDLAKFEGRKLLTDCPSSSSPSSRNSTACSGLSIFSCFSNIRTRRKIAVQIRSLNTKIERISKLGERFLTFDNTTPNTGKVSALKLRQTSPLVEPNLVGKEIIHATTRLVELMLAHKEQKAYKVAIVGTGGIGKTTLAQKIYNDQRIKEKFSIQTWICVTQEYSVITIMKEILQKIKVHLEQDETIGGLQSKLATAIEGKNFFLVLDDVWQPEVWTNLLRIPLHAATTGVILVTTRDDTIALKIGAEYTHRVELMSRDVGWELLWKSMNINDEKEVQNLRDTGIEIVQKCGGLPLAIRVVASVLATKERTNNQWRKILSNNAWSMSKLPAELRGALYLSYDELPVHLKQCFLHCALYPEDILMHRDDLIRFWISEGFIEKQEDQLLEDTAEEYYYELISRNLLEVDDSCHHHQKCKMHDLLRHLAQNLSSEEYFLGDTQSLDAASTSKLRRVGLYTKEENKALPSSVDKELRTVRTLVFWRCQSLVVDNTLFLRLPNLRVLDLTGSLLENIPYCIRGLIHLRLLDLNTTSISCLPESIGYLVNLQTLNIGCCYSLHSLPLAITQLCNLRHLGLMDTPIKQVPKGIGKLAFLNDIEGFPVGSGHGNIEMQDGWDLEELVPLSYLRKLDMIMLERAFLSGSTTSLLEDKHHLKILTLQCTDHHNESFSEEDASKVESIFEKLIPPCQLEQLYIIRFFGRRYPTWLHTHRLFSVKYLDIIDCISWRRLPPIGELPNLRSLRIKGAGAISKIGIEFLGVGVANQGSAEAVAFPKLDELCLGEMHNWDDWSLIEKKSTMEGEEDGTVGKQRGEAPLPNMQLFPCLQELKLSRCPLLRALPQQLAQATCLKSLHIEESSCLKVVENLPFLSDSLLIEQCDGLERVSNLPCLRELHIHDCPNLRCVDMFGNLQRLCLSEEMRKSSPPWVSELQQQCRQLHGQDLQLYTSRRKIPN